MANEIHWETLDRSSNIVSIAGECNKCKEKVRKFTYFKIEEEEIKITFLCDECIEPFVKKPETKESEGLSTIRSEAAQSFIETGELSRIGDTSMGAKIYHETIDEKGVEGDRRESARITPEEREEIEGKEEEEKEEIVPEQTGPPEWLNKIMDASFSTEDAKEISEDETLTLESKQNWFKYIQTSLGEANPFIKLNLMKIFKELYTRSGGMMPDENYEIINEFISSEEMDHRRIAAVSLSQIGGNRAIQMLSERLSVEDEKKIRRTIEHGLKMLKK
ncbi:MAG: HEAT repeat domain-containing protein [Candidatus Heimdallarchaeota archaeon]|nr:HEAT repeat domain-containing protein [Candidatus Heimdallarchaeota archaeon]MCK5048231.1 HEAT repeat domain-containing protein [Candidatus Heimdallarchaeota archaeon]